MEELPIIPRGIRFQAGFITPEHEAELMHIFRNELDWPTTKKFASRKSLHYGYTFDYKTFGIDPNIPYKPFPEWLQPLIPRTAQGGRDPDQVCLQYYPPGAGIPPHVDTHSAYDELYALSLGSAVMMQFRHTRAREDSKAKEGGVEETPEEGRAKDEREIVDVDLPPRSMMEMSGDSRLHWEHGIKKRKKDVLADGTVRMRGDRWSITYRWLREGGQCECGDERLCDTAQRRIGVEREFRWKQQQPQGSMREERQQEGEREGLGGIEDKGVLISRQVGSTGVDQGHHQFENGNILLSPL
ncbi:hypothetical protein RRF57_006359 [Xylaria bambusicola]|uniref:Fe2OG dioxygenase domain-containing protein n=1 Tax=Xylaria bambusicola TaxID=326684 RepID=A0AAN7USD6_9PEZI